MSRKSRETGACAGANVQQIHHFEVIVAGHQLEMQVSIIMVSMRE